MHAAVSLLIACSTFGSVQDNTPAPTNLVWEELAQRLINPVIVPAKADVGLWNAVLYEPGKPRKTDAITAVSAFVIDFDNAEEYVDSSGAKHKRCVANPTTPADVESRLVGREFIIASTFSNQPSWPRFRLVMPFVQPVASGGWPERASGLLSTLQLDQLAGVDSIYKNANAIYYWPALPPGSTGVFLHGKGVYLSPEVPNLPTDIAGAKLTLNSLDDRFTVEQIEKYYRDRVPAFEMHESGNEYRGMCPFHGGEGAHNFAINRQTGLWMCHSQCELPDGRKMGGDIYEFEARLFGYDFKTAKVRVNTLLDVDDDRSSYKPFDVLTKDVEAATPETLPEVKKAIAAHGNLRQRNTLIRQLVATQQLDSAAVKNEIRELRNNIKTERSNLIKFPTHNQEAAAKLEAERRAEQIVAEGTPNTPYGLCLPPNKYYADWTGVYPVRGVMRGDQFDYEPVLTKPILPRPMWPHEMGTDVITGDTYMHLYWFSSDSRNRIRNEWMPGDRSNNRDALLVLNDAPVSIPRVPDISEYLSVAKACLTKPRKNLASSIGWVRGNTRFVMDNDPDVTYIGRPVKRCGDVTGWTTGLQEILDIGSDGYTALCVVGLAAAAPLVRLVNKRNPIIGLVSDSSRGKGTVLNFALSIWNEPSALTLPAGSTGKGVQDMSIGNSDLPVFADEIQQLKKIDPRRVEEVLYYLANGQRRVTSSRAQVAKGGERRYGPAFLASEIPVLEGAQRGAQFRVIELCAEPVKDAKMAQKIQAATFHNTGTVGIPLATLINADYEARLKSLDSSARAWQFAAHHLEGDDAYAIATVSHGLELLQAVVGVKLPITSCVKWLIAVVEAQRQSTKDNYVYAWEQMLSVITSQTWPGLMHPNVLDDNHEYVAFRRDQAIDPVAAPLEINPSAVLIRETLRSIGHGDTVSRIWADRGWIAKNGTETKWVRSSKEGKGVRTWRVTELGLMQIGLTNKLEAL